MNKILILGAGLSASSLIQYLLDNAPKHQWIVRVGDKDLATAQQKIGTHKHGEAFAFDVFNEQQVTDEVANATVIISMLPARFHPMVANTCVAHNKHMITASYVSAEVKTLNEEAKNKGLLLLNEIGVDPGIDHMSAMQVIDQIKAEGGTLEAFYSSTGGLIAPEYDTNPWHYKFTWNPRNVVVAGQSTARYLEKGQVKYVPYHQLFRRYRSLSVLDLGNFEMYPNRDSLGYRETYDLPNIPTILRGTLRRPGYCDAWNVFVQLGATDDTYKLDQIEKMTYRDFMESFLPADGGTSTEEKLASYLNLPPHDEVMQKLTWLGIFNETPIGLKEGTPAQVLQKLLVEKWALGEHDKDMIVMQHQFDYTNKSGERKRKLSSLIVRGKDKVHTAMSITVGIPVAIATKLLLTGTIKATGVVIPTKPDIYQPVLNELKDFGIEFIEEEIPLH
ncbi:MAG: saccharopine dehydrogenase C-terminal domain-containing protein [Bacteroidales bacterium]